MSYVTDIQARDGYLRVEVSGERVPGQVADNARSLIAGAAAQMEQRGMQRCLLVLRVKGALSAIDAFDLVGVVESSGWKRSYRLAAVDMNRETLDDVRFAEVVAANRAFPVAVFDNEEDAVAWLFS